MEKTPITPDIPALEDQTSSVLAATKKELLQLDSLISSTHLTESEIQKKYCTLPDDQISLLCSYTTRLEGFLDILLSGNISSSKEAERLLGKVHTHRGDSM
ncbi:hypothetical protein FACS189428_5730 [Clostridia bacterium]|nr:hypothetical protein FACS189428_5730 [Clostridia bacterium]